MLTKLFEAIRESAVIEKLEIGGRNYLSRVVVPVREPEPAALVVSNLSSLVEYVRSVAERDMKQPPTSLVVHVESPREASVISEISGEFCQRRIYLKASESCTWKGAGQWMPLEQFIIMIQSQFVQDDTTAAILRLIGNIDDSAVANFSDDGITQTVTARTGIVKRENVAVPSRVTLTPFRSFTEADQAPSAFVLRMATGKDGQPPSAALFEADGGHWKTSAMAGVCRYLHDNLPTGVVVLG